MWFIIGLLAGAGLGMGLMCLLFACRGYDD